MEKEQEKKMEPKSEFLKRVNEMAHELAPMVKDSSENRAVVIVATDDTDYEPYEDGTKPANTSMAIMGRPVNVSATIAMAMKDEVLAPAFDVATIMADKSGLLDRLNNLREKSDGIRNLERLLQKQRKYTLRGIYVGLTVCALWSAFLVTNAIVGLQRPIDQVADLLLMGFCAFLGIRHLKLVKTDIKNHEED